MLAVVYLLFNEGYSVPAAPVLTRSAPSSEAIRLGRLLLGLMPEPEVMGLLAFALRAAILGEMIRESEGRRGKAAAKPSSS